MEPPTIKRGRTKEDVGERKVKGKGFGKRKGHQKGALGKGKTTHVLKIGRGVRFG